MAVIEYTKTLVCPESGETVEVNNVCLYCDYYEGEAAGGNVEGYGIRCTFSDAARKRKRVI